MIKSDIETKLDIEKLVNSFYAKAMKNEAIGYFFNTIEAEKWQVHLSIMYSFWASVLLGEATYKGNVMHRHIDLNQIKPLEKSHFDTWLNLFLATVDELFEGEIADEAKRRANLMSDLMQFKIEQSQNKGFIQ